VEYLSRVQTWRLAGLKVQIAKGAIGRFWAQPEAIWGGFQKVVASDPAGRAVKIRTAKIVAVLLACFSHPWAEN